jgi:hypothetical protein
MKTEPGRWGFIMKVSGAWLDRNGGAFREPVRRFAAPRD